MAAKARQDRARVVLGEIQAIGDDRSDYHEAVEAIVPKSKSIGEALADARFDRRAIAEHRAQQRKDTELKLIKFSADGVSKTEMLFSDKPGIQQLLPCLNVVPLQPITWLTFEPTAAPRAACTAAMIKHGSRDKQGRTPLQSFLADWIVKHNMKKHADSESIPKESSYEKKWKCWRAGVCICKGIGVKIGKFHTSINEAMKKRISA